MELKDVEKLAELARIELDENEKEAFLTELSSVLTYVDQISEVQVPDEASEHELVNAMREDGTPHDSEEYREKILNEMPDREGDFLKVQQIL